MEIEQIHRSILDWFATAKAASLELPQGWFGRPYDNLHRLTWSACSSHKVLVELDNQLLLIITDPDRVEATASELRINHAAQVTLDWQEYGNLRPHVDDHGGGSLRFVAHGAGSGR